MQYVQFSAWCTECHNLAINNLYILPVTRQLAGLPIIHYLGSFALTRCSSDRYNVPLTRIKTASAWRFAFKPQISRTIKLGQYTIYECIFKNEKAGTMTAAIISRVNIKLRLTAYKSSAVGGQSKLVLGLYGVPPEAGRRHKSHVQYRLQNAVTSILAQPRYKQIPNRYLPINPYIIHTFGDRKIFHTPLIRVLGLKWQWNNQIHSIFLSQIVQESLKTHCTPLPTHQATHSKLHRLAGWCLTALSAQIGHIIPYQ